MTLKHPRVLPALSEFGIFYPIATAPPDLAPAHNNIIRSWIVYFVKHIIANFKLLSNANKRNGFSTSRWFEWYYAGTFFRLCLCFRLCLLCLLLGLLQLVLQFRILLGLVVTDYRRRSSATDKGAQRNKKPEPFEVDFGSTRATS
jgi:hypothetical protein